ncbi:MAG: pyridoxine 5'-phosphate synthase [Enterobacteriaceae bacterium PSpicST2]|nr:MAG: pyridoxine 5'-phosphate synthase [Enterobacteriaceae bacterium PSpicST2]WMC19153.1 MAG: pyridoxine 5'-phosphate synthase [Enterobacteriaceae bacterium PSpicST1]
MNKLSFGINKNYLKNFKNKKNLISNLLQIALISEQIGINSITINLSKNYKYIKKYINILKKIIQIYINFEIEIYDEILNTILKIKPKSCYLFSKKKNEITKEGGLNIINKFEEISIIVNLLNNNNIEAFLFIDPNLNQIDAAINTGTKYIKLNTNMYSLANNNLEKMFQFNKIKKSVIYAKKKGLIVNVGYGLNYENIKKLSKIKQINEFNISNSILNKGLFIGLKKAIKKILLLIN